MRVYVVAKKDRDAVRHVFEQVYGYVPEILTLGGEKGRIEEEINQIPRKDFTIVLLGREDARWVENDPSGAWLKVEVFEKARVRNGRMRQIVSLIERAKARFVTDVRWEETYVLGKRGFIGPVPGTDVFLAHWEEYRRVLSLAFGRDVGTPLIVHRGSVDALYAGGKPLGTLDRETLHVVDRGTEGTPVDFREAVRMNREHAEEKADVTVEKIKRATEGRDVVIPFSGGKDSLTVYTLTREAGVDATPVFVDTGAEYEETRRIADMVGAEVVEAPVARRFREIGESYLLSRACTRDKLAALYDYVRRSFDDPILLVGDRNAESKARSMRPEARRDEFDVFAPIKFWSYLDEQIYLRLRGVELNRLYRVGFYRIGCTFCPFTDRFERLITKAFI